MVGLTERALSSQEVWGIKVVINIGPVGKLGWLQYFWKRVLTAVLAPTLNEVATSTMTSYCTVMEQEHIPQLQKTLITSYSSQPVGLIRGGPMPDMVNCQCQRFVMVNQRENFRMIKWKKRSKAICRFSRDSYVEASSFNLPLLLFRFENPTLFYLFILNPSFS